MKTKTLLVVCFSIFLSCSYSFAGSKGTLGKISDTLAIGLPTIAFGCTLYESPVDAGIFALQLASQEAFVEGGKSALSGTSLGERPSGGDKGGISSHVSAATAGAIQLWEVYPDNLWVKSLSAIGVSVVAYQRIEGEHHNALQVGLGMGTAFLFDYLGEVITDYFRKSDTASFLTNGNEQNIFINFIPPENGNGMVGLITLKF